MRQYGRLRFIHTKPAAWKLLSTGIGLKRLEKGIMCHLECTNVTILGPVTLANKRINSPLRDLLVTFCHDLEKLCKIREGFGTELWHFRLLYLLSVPNLIIFENKERP